MYFVVEIVLYPITLTNIHSSAIFIVCILQIYIKLEYTGVGWVRKVIRTVLDSLEIPESLEVR